ncbi:unnamed protein product [Rotaria sp. Silwood2]|nr:unnamed protein product [Rotaria sp. Silwood2]
MSEYRPSNKIVTFTVTFPMVEDMCYLIPVSAMQKIPRCQSQFSRTSLAQMNKTRRPTQDKTKTTKSNSVIGKTRSKRLIAEIISIAVGTASLALTTANTFQTLNLKSEVSSLTNSLQSRDRIMNNNRAQILHLNEGQFKLVHELNHTEFALNQTIQLVNEHSEILRRTDDKMRTIHSMTLFLNERLAALIHAVEAHFIHTSIENIMKNNLNLDFIHHKDLPRVVELIVEATNITFDDSTSSIPIIALISKLLVQQRIDFIPVKSMQKTESGNIIGKLVFTSFFAASDINQPTFLIYELVPIPFKHGPNRVRLAQMPAFIGIDPQTLQFVRWSTEEARSCDFTLMSSCRETPAIRKDLEDNCLYQILTDSPLSSCRVEAFSDSVFIHRIGQHWAVSTNSTTKCHSVKTSNMEQHRITDTAEITLPPVALITTVDTNSLVCDRFYLPGLPIKLGATVSLIQNSTVNPIEEDFIDLHSMIGNNTHWAKLPYIPSNIQAVIDFISNTPKPETTLGYKEWINHPMSFTGIIVACIGIILLSSLVYYFRSKKKQEYQFHNHYAILRSGSSDNSIHQIH